MRKEGAMNGRTGEGAGRGPLSLGLVARAGMVLVAVWALANLLWLAVDVLFVAFFAMLVAVFLSLGAGLLARLRVPRAVAVPATLLLCLGALAGGVALAWPTLSAELATVARDLPESLSRVGRTLEAEYERVAGELGAPGDDGEARLAESLRNQAGALASGALPVVRGAAGAVSGLLLVLFAGIFLAIEPAVYLRQGLRVLPLRRRGTVEAALREAGTTLRGWMAGTLVSMSVIAVLTTAGLWVLGIPAALALGVLAGLSEFVPTIGPILSALPAISLALLESPAKALQVAGFYLALQFVESNLLTPLVMRRAVELPPALSLFFQTLMGLVFGFLGLLLAVPILAVGLVLVRRLYVEPLEAAG